MDSNLVDFWFCDTHGTAGTEKKCCTTATTIGWMEELLQEGEKN